MRAATRLTVQERFDPSKATHAPAEELPALTALWLAAWGAMENAEVPGWPLWEEEARRAPREDLDLPQTSAGLPPGRI